MLSAQESAIPIPIRSVFRGIGQIVFQENAITGILFVVGILLSSPLMAGGIVLGAIVGTATAWLLKFDAAQRDAGIWGFNPALVGIATLFFFQPSALTFVLLVVGAVVATLVTWAMRRFVPFPTYTTPFIVTTWVLFLIGPGMGLAKVTGDGSLLLANPPLGSVVEAASHGIGQIVFQASFWTGLFFLVGIALSDQRHAGLVLIGSLVGMLLAGYHVDALERAIDPEKLIERSQMENVQLGLYGYNATLAAVALYLWRRSLIVPILGMIVSVPLTELIPRLGIPALTAPFVLATWIVLGLGWIEQHLLKDESSGKSPAPNDG